MKNLNLIGICDHNATENVAAVKRAAGEVMLAVVGGVEMASREEAHILGLFDFLKGPGTTSPMLEALRREKFEDFASRYNGPGQAAIDGERIATYYERFRALRT